MCGFLIQIDNASQVDRDCFNAARDSMTHRGPDAFGSVFLQDGHVALGHRRLSIQDLSEAANQPMQLGALWVVYNGEIYNFPELKRELEQHGGVFRTHCDTEVLLHGYREWGGKKLCEKCRGMFAFAIWDDEKSECFLARDRIGQKPLYYAVNGGQFVAASELGAVRELQRERKDYRREAFAELLRYGYIPEPNTFYEDIQCLLPGHSMLIRCEPGRISSHTFSYWTFTPDIRPEPTSRRSARLKLDELLNDVVETHLLADVEVGAFLSGGLDSSVIVALLHSRLNAQSLKTFCIGMGQGEIDEAPRAARTAAFLRTEHASAYVQDDAFMCKPQKVLDIFGQPFGDFSLVPTEEVSRLAATRVKTVLTGDGGDEVFGGYGHYAVPFQRRPMSYESLRIFQWSVRARWRDAQQRWRAENFGHAAMTTDQVLNVIHPSLRAELSGYDIDHYYRANDVRELDPFRRAQWIDIKTYLPSDILVKVDRCAMQHSLETRPPFLDHKLVEFVMNLPRKTTNPGAQSKWLLRRWATQRIPDEVLEAPKRGFGLPVHHLPKPVLDRVAHEQLSCCIGHELLDLNGADVLSGNPYLFWMVRQFECALEKNG